MTDQVISCFLVDRDDDGPVISGPSQVPTAGLPDGDVEITVEYSSLNYKDALAAGGHPGVVRRFPHVPGIDAAGTVVVSDDPALPIGSAVLVTGYELGAPRWGGWAERVRVPRDWVHRLPGSMSPHRAMQLGTAGLTAALAVEAIERAGIEAGDGPLLVTGATGGVGILSVMILDRLGYEVVASTGKPECHQLLVDCGAGRVIGRDEVLDTGDRPLATGRWTAAIDSVGGETLAAIVRGMQPRGLVAACGLVGGTDVPLTVYPFLLRGITLQGIDSADCPREQRARLWERLASEWSPGDLDQVSRSVDFEGLPETIESMLAGRHVGRTVVRVAGDPSG